MEKFHAQFYKHPQEKEKVEKMTKNLHSYHSPIWNALVQGKQKLKKQKRVMLRQK